MARFQNTVTKGKGDSHLVISGVTKVSSAVHFIMPDEASVDHSPAFVLFGVSQPGQPFFSVLGFAVQLH